MQTFILLFALFFTPSATLSSVDEGQFLGGKIVEDLPDWFKNSFLDLTDDLTEAAAKNRHIMIYFHQNGCPYCAKLVNENFHNPKLVAKLKRDFDSIEVNIWGDRELTDWQDEEFSEKQFAAKMRVQFTPTLLFLDHQGQSVLRLNGYQSTAKMQVALDYVAGKKYREQSFASYLASKVKNPVGKLNKNPLFDNPPHLLSRNKNLPSQRYLAVFFEQPNCAECDDFHQDIMSLDTTKKLLKQMQVVQLNALSEDKIINPAGVKTTPKKWYENLKLTYKPAVVFFDKNGLEVIRKDAFFKSYHFQGIITYVTSGAYKTQPKFQRYLEAKSTKLRKQGITVDIWK